MLDARRIKQNDILSSGYAFHAKPFAIPYIEHMKSYLFRLQTEGRCRALVDGELADVGPGDLLLYGPGDAYELAIGPHALPDGEADCISGDYYIFFRGSSIDGWWQQKKRPQRIKTSMNDGILAVMRQIASEHRKVSQYSGSILDHLSQILFLSIDRATSESPKQGQAFVAYQIKNYIEQNASRPFNLKEVAVYADISVSRAVHLFKQVFGRSIMQYTLDVRLNLARERVIYSPMPLQYVAETSGFANYTYFYRVFRGKYGMAPGEYRRRFGDFLEAPEP